MSVTNGRDRYGWNTRWRFALRCSGRRKLRFSQKSLQTFLLRGCNPNFVCPYLLDDGCARVEPYWEIATR
jgi:hypothetical protein